VKNLTAIRNCISFVASLTKVSIAQSIASNDFMNVKDVGGCGRGLI
jgi:hypothetical protein